MKHLTKSQYEAIGKVIGGTYWSVADESTGPAQQHAIARLVKNLSILFEQTDDEFNLARFSLLSFTDYQDELPKRIKD